MSAILKVREILRLLREDGWFHVRTTGSHHHFRHPTKPGTVTVLGSPNHDPRRGQSHFHFVKIGTVPYDLHPKTLGSILKQSGLERGKER
jgi:predicted RNA binding protein YcfA (HicA-like mRNA interferase family)